MPKLQYVKPPYKRYQSYKNLQDILAKLPESGQKINIAHKVIHPFYEDLKVFVAQPDFEYSPRQKETISRSTKLIMHDYIQKYIAYHIDKFGDEEMNQKVATHILSCLGGLRNDKLREFGIIKKKFHQTSTEPSES